MPPSRYRPTRREFLGALPLAAAAAACGRARYNRADFILPAQSPVALLPASGYGEDMADVISRGWISFTPTCGFLAMGSDFVAVDATCARLMGLDPAKIRYLREASRYLGNMDPARLVQRGEHPARFESTFELIEQMKSLRRLAP